MASLSIGTQWRSALTRGDEQAHRQSLAVAVSPHAAEDQDFIEAISDRPAE
jgi:hypothetical protein